MRFLSISSKIAALFVVLVVVQPASAQTSFINFESGHVRPMAMSPDGSRLFVANTPDNRLEIFDIDGSGLTFAESVPVGMEPVAVAALSNSTVYVVNHLSDSVSVVDVGSSPAAVVRTLLVGDEPRDIVFAGTGGTSRAFVTTARRGQHRTHASIAGVPGAGDPDFLTDGIGRADVWVFDTTALGAAVGGVPEEILTVFSDTPRALAVSNDGSTVYVAGFNTGNQTTVVSSGAVCDGFAGASACSGDGITSPGGLPGGDLPGGNPGPTVDGNGIIAPEVGLIVKYNRATSTWEDELGRNWNNGVRFDLPDEDVFAIDADSWAQVAVHAHVGTTLFNMAVHPGGDLFVSNTESINEVRFEGPGIVGGSTVQGHLAESRITVIDNPNTTDMTGASVKPRHLNKHIDYNTLANEPGFDATAKNHSLATPLEIVFNSLGTTMYVAAFGSNLIGVFDPATVEGDTFDPTLTSSGYLAVSGGGPSGLVLDETNNQPAQSGAGGRDRRPSVPL
jgi:YVTN family beta-propeller protein